MRFVEAQSSVVSKHFCWVVSSITGLERKKIYIHNLGWMMNRKPILESYLTDVNLMVKWKANNSKQVVMSSSIPKVDIYSLSGKEL